MVARSDSKLCRAIALDSHLSTWMAVGHPTCRDWLVGGMVVISRRTHRVECERSRGERRGWLHLRPALSIYAHSHSVWTDQGFAGRFVVCKGCRACLGPGESAKVAGWLGVWTCDGVRPDAHRWALSIRAAVRYGGAITEQHGEQFSLGAWRRQAGEFPQSGVISASAGTQVAWVGQCVDDTGDTSTQAIGSRRCRGA